MTRYPTITLTPHLTVEELKQRYRTDDDANAARRWHVLWLFSTGKPIGVVAELVGMHRNGVRALIKRYNADGPTAMGPHPPRTPRGRQPALTVEQQHDLEQALAGAAPDGGLWTGPKVATWMSARIGRRIYPQLGWVYLRKLDFVLRQPRPQHQDAASAEQQAAWKKN